MPGQACIFTAFRASLTLVPAGYQRHGNHPAHGGRADRSHRRVSRGKAGRRYQSACRDLLQLHRRFRCAGSPEDPGSRHYHGNKKRRSTQLRPGAGCGMNFSENKKAECPLQDTQIL